ncbi:H-NS histone family protein [Cronobacter turicensis]|nr:H-NS histone family protein [Cronobacter turicensis]ELZ8935152.1 H-NS histone family protein [Cronobacter dublinensis]EMA8648543.1 H-NS histone family protein [Cronobacter turicensis]
MSDVFKAFNNIRNLRANARTVPLETLEELLEKLAAIVSERRDEDISRKAQQSERNTRLDELRRMMAEDGIDPSELLRVADNNRSGQRPSQKTRPPRPAKYEYKNEKGDTVTWTGQGRMPHAISAQIATGKTLTDFLIHKQ